MKNIVKILTALATIAGVIYIIATYGEQIVAWCKKVLASLPCCQQCSGPALASVKELEPFPCSSLLAA